LRYDNRNALINSIDNYDWNFYFSCTELSEHNQKVVDHLKSDIFNEAAIKNPKHEHMLAGDF